MIQKIKFHRTKDKRWHLDLPEWETEDLERTEPVLNLLSLGEDTIYLQMGDEKFPGASPLIFLEVGPSSFGGAWYLLPSHGDKDLDLRIWIGEGIKSIFGQFPETIWFYKSF